MWFSIRHTSHYKYSQRVTRCYNLANVAPRDTDRQRCLSNRISISPQPINAAKRADYFGNTAYHFEIQKMHSELIITAESEVDLFDRDPALDLDIGLTYADAVQYFKKQSNAANLSAREFLLDSPMVAVSPELTDYAKESFISSRSLKTCVSELTSRIYSDFIFDPKFTTVSTPLSEVIKHKRGVCQDFAHLQVGCLRAMGIPAKYVSGYIETLPKPGEEKLVGADATHAWIAYYSPDQGWIEFDPTNNTPANNQHIVTAFGRDYYDVTPVKGVIFGGGENQLLTVSVDVQRNETRN